MTRTTNPKHIGGTGMNFKMATGEDFTIQTKGGYTLTAPDKTGTLATVGDVPPNNVAVIELDWERDWEEGATTQLDPGTYDYIVNLLNQGKIVVFNARQNGGPLQQLYLSYGPEFYDDFFTFSTIPDELPGYTYITINSDDTCIISSHVLEGITNKVTSLSSSSTDTQYPSAKCVYDIVGDIETLINAL